MVGVLFEVNISKAGQARYLQLAEVLKPLLEKAEGFISVERFESLSQPGKLLSLSWWEDESSVLKWKQQTLHRMAQQEGRDTLFSEYTIHVVQTLRVSRFIAPHAHSVSPNNIDETDSLPEFSQSEIHQLGPSPVIEPTSLWSQFWDTLRHCWQKYRIRHQTQQTLTRMNEFQLRDIGLTADELRRRYGNFLSK